MQLSHPTIEELEGFLKNASRSGRTVVLRHLLAGCAICRDRLRAAGWTGTRLERLVHLPASTARRDAGSGRDDVAEFDYADAFAKAEQAVIAFSSAPPPPPVPLATLLDRLAETPRDRQSALVEEDEDFASPPLVGVLVDRSNAARYADPEVMLHWARLARSIATRCSPEALGSAARLHDLRGRAWGQYGTALRVAGRLRDAEEALVTAQRYLKIGTGDPALKARLREQFASLDIVHSRFAAAIAALAEAAEIYRQLGDTHSLAGTLIHQAIALVKTGEAEQAVNRLNHAIPLIDHERDPQLLLAACHNLVQCYIHLGQPGQALAIYSEARSLYKEFSDDLILLRAEWQEGQILRDLGHLRDAEAALLRARAGFMAREMMHEVAVVCLDLAAVYVQLKASEELQQTVTAAVPVFRALGVDREALAALLQLHQVAGQEQQAMDLIRLLSARIEPLARQGGR